MIGYNFWMHEACVFLFLLLLLLLPTRHAVALRRRVLLIVLAGRAIEVNRPYLCSGADRERNCTSENEPFQHVVDCVVSVVAAVPAAEHLAKMQAARLPLQRRIRDPEMFRGSLGQKRRSVSQKAPLQDQFSERK